MFDFTYEILSDEKEYNNDFKLKITDDLFISREVNELCIELKRFLLEYNYERYSFKYKTEWTPELKKFIYNKLKRCTR